MKGATAFTQSYNVELLSAEPAQLWGPRRLETWPQKTVTAQDYAEAARQSWRFAEAPRAIAGCRHAVLVRDHRGPRLPPRQRLSRFLRVLSGVLEKVPCQAIYWEPSRQIVDPRRFTEACHRGEMEAFLCGPLNLRLFRVDHSDGEMLMDTLGLGALGLFDLQCHFRGLEPKEVATVLYNTAVAVLEKEDVLAEGETVPGILPGTRWAWRRRTSRADPRRQVIDLDSGTVLPSPRPRPVELGAEHG